MAFVLLCLWTFLLHVDICLVSSYIYIVSLPKNAAGYSLVMTGSAKHPSFTLTCTVNNASGLDDLVLFNRNTSVGVIAGIRQSTGHCSMFKFPPAGYVVSCGSGTENTASQTKTYTLQISEVRDEDFTFWWCSLKTDGTQSNKYRLIVNASPDKNAGGGESESDALSAWCNTVTWLFVGIITVGVIIIVVVNAGVSQQTMLIALNVDIVCLEITVIITTVLLVHMRNVDKSHWSWTAAVILCALGCFFIIIFFSFALMTRRVQRVVY